MNKKVNKKGQMHTIEAILALMIIIGIIAFAARSAPQETQIESSLDTQLMLYGEDFLSILDLEDEHHRSWLYGEVNGTVSGSRNGAANITREWQNTTLNGSGIFCKVEIVNFTQAGQINVLNSSSTYGEPPQNAVTVTRLVTLVNPPEVEVYEVRLTLWYI